jgi:hypothetical protein
LPDNVDGDSDPAMGYPAQHRTGKIAYGGSPEVKVLGRPDRPARRLPDGHLIGDSGLVEAVSIPTADDAPDTKGDAGGSRHCGRGHRITKI